jgi:hypothetical protein
MKKIKKVADQMFLWFMISCIYIHEFIFGKKK